jgi:RNA recognition motif-containing protein
MGRKLYVGNLPYSATEESLSTKFSEHGTVETVKVITDRDTGRSKGFGFIEMGSDAEAQAAIAALNGADLDGRTIKVNEAKPQTRNPGSGHGEFGRRGRW